jgi:hypothetical protein
MLAVSGGENQVHVMIEDTDGNWTEKQAVGEDMVQEASAAQM